ncbi:MAG: gliding motility-associated C-terminal domain-containing protein, partial [Bacteroidota bacterium]
ENSADYTVDPDPDTPVADAGMDQTAGCGQPATLDGSGSTAPATNITYQWVGTPDLNDPMAVSPEATEAGTYQLIVTNTTNSCADTSEVVTVTFEFPDDANAGADAASCDDIFDLSGNLPTNGANITGVWTTASGAIIDMANNPVTMVSGLAQGGNLFTWTLSADGCPDYSSDDVQITSASAPIANPDFLEIEADVLTGEVSLVANDILGGSTNFTITILNDPIFGTFDPAALELGTFALTLLPGQFGVSTVDYEICSTDCPDLCSTSTLNIAVAQSDNPFVPNVVTPNGDGDNDDLVFDVITFSDPDEIPDNELIIFNRWGDIIFEAKPYNNDWNGLNQEGQPIPEATYYYVLRLNISRGEIIRGDITVIR